MFVSYDWSVSCSQVDVLQVDIGFDCRHGTCPPSVVRSSLDLRECRAPDTHRTLLSCVCGPCFWLGYTMAAVPKIPHNPRDLSLIELRWLLGLGMHSWCCLTPGEDLCHVASSLPLPGYTSAVRPSATFIQYRCQTRCQSKYKSRSTCGGA